MTTAQLLMMLWLFLFQFVTIDVKWGENTELVRFFIRLAFNLVLIATLHQAGFWGSVSV